MNITSTTSAVFWDSLLFDDLEQLDLFYNINEDWKDFLDEEQVLEFLEIKHEGSKTATYESFGDFYENHSNGRNELFSVFTNKSMDIEEYISENEICVDVWTLAQLIESGRMDFISKLLLLDIESSIAADDFSVALLLFALGKFATEEIFDFFYYNILNVITDFDTSWGPVAIGIALGNNLEMFSTVYEDIFSEDYYDISSYYYQWTVVAHAAAKKQRNKEVFEKFSEL
jgi:hypothetical protein